MPKWNAATLKNKVFADLDAKITITKQPGGDYDTVRLQITRKGRGGDTLFIAGFNDGKSPLEPKDDVDVPMVEVSDGNDSAGGLNSDDEKTGILYGQVCARLRKLGFEVVPKMDPYLGG